MADQKQISCGLHRCQGVAPKKQRVDGPHGSGSHQGDEAHRVHATVSGNTACNHEHQSDDDGEVATPARAALVSLSGKST